jgi:arabinofuranosyltransferase
MPFWKRISGAPLPARIAVLTGLALTAFAVVTLRTAWVCDDAFITLRTVDNWVNGYGLRWNVVERVQAYTHPLWMLLLAGAYALTREAYYTTVYLSVATSLAAVAVAARVLGFGRWAAPAAVALLTVSKAFTDYSTSGLENPLSHLLLAGFVGALFAQGVATPRRSFALFGLGALLALTRLDLVALIAPALLLFLVRNWSSRTVRSALLALAPLLAWEAFSVIYYGFPLPNTAYAKLHINAPLAVIARQGMWYAANLLRQDPVSGLAIVAALLLPPIAMWRARTWDGRTAALVAGIALHLLYVVAIGGDFMAGRFFTAPLLVAVLLLGLSVRAMPPRPIPLALTACLVAAGIAMPRSPVRSDAAYGAGRKTTDDIIDAHEVADERAYYYQCCGLLRVGFPCRGSRKLYKEEKASKHRGEPPRTLPKSNIGYYGYFAGPTLDIVDAIGLSDPLLARLPTKRLESFRPGHIPHDIPKGYLASRLVPTTRLADPGIAAYNDALTEITRGELFTVRRWERIVELNLGAYDALIEGR